MATVFEKCRLCPGSRQRLSSGTPGRVQADTLPVGLVVCKLNLTLLARQSRAVQLRKVSTAGLITFKGVIDVTRN